MNLEAFLYVLCDGDKIPVYEDELNQNRASTKKQMTVSEVLTSPRMKGLMTASDLKAPLTSALQRLKEEPEHFYPFVYSYEYGTYIDFTRFACAFRNACIQHPRALIG